MQFEINVHCMNSEYFFFQTETTATATNPLPMFVSYWFDGNQTFQDKLVHTNTQYIHATFETIYSLLIVDTRASHLPHIRYGCTEFS